MPQNPDSIDKEQLLANLGLKNDSGDLVGDKTTQFRPDGGKEEKPDLVCYLELINTNQKGKFLAVMDKLSIGREDGDHKLGHPSVSNRHCTFFFNSGVPSLMDNGSKNGTQVNGTQLRPGQMILLEEEDLVTIGDIELKVSLRMGSEISSKQLAGHVQKGSFKESLFLLLAKAKSIFKKKPGSKKKKNKIKEKKEKKAQTTKPKKAKIKVLLPMAGAPIRIMALLADIAFTYVALSYFSSVEELKIVHESMVGSVGPILDEIFAIQEIAPHLAPYKNKIYMLAPFVYFYLLQNIVFVLLTGVNLPQFLMGMRGAYNIIWARVGGVVRTFLALLTTPLLIFDIPALFGKKTFKESLSYTALIYEASFHKKIITFSVIILLIPVAFIYPLLTDFSLINGVEVIEKAGTSKKTPPKLTNPKEYYSNLFKIRFDMAADNPFVFIPLFELIKDNGTTYHQVGMQGYDTQNNIRVLWKTVKKFSLHSLLTSAKRQNLLFDLKFPYLSQEMAKSSSEWRPRKRLGAKRAADAPRMKDKSKQDLNKFMQAALKIGFPSLLDHLVKYGPFIKSFTETRGQLLNYTNLPGLPVVATQQLGNYSFLSFSLPAQSEQAKLLKFEEEVIMPIGSYQGEMYSLTWFKGPGLKKAKRHLIKEGLSQAEWSFGFKDAYPPFWNREDEQGGNLSVLQPFDIVEHLLNSQLTNTQRQTLETYTYKYFKEMGARSLKEGQEDLRGVLVLSLKRLTDVYKFVFKRQIKKEGGQKEFYGQMNEMYVYLKEKNLNYFGIQ